MSLQAGVNRAGFRSSARPAAARAIWPANSRAKRTCRFTSSTRCGVTSASFPAKDTCGPVELIAAGDKWIIDGHYRDVRHLVWRRADTVLWLNYPLGLIAARLLRRFAAGRRSGDREKKDAAVPPATRAGWKRRLGRLARTLRERSEYGRLLRSAEYRQLSVVELKSVSATEDWLRRLDG